MANNGKNGDPDECDCMQDAELDSLPKIYRVAYRVYAVDSCCKKHIVLEVSRAHMVGLDVADITAKIKSDHINREYNHNFGDSLYHVVGTNVTIYSIRYMAILNSITDGVKDRLGIEYDYDELDEDPKEDLSDDRNGTDM